MHSLHAQFWMHGYGQLCKDQGIRAVKENQVQLLRGGGGEDECGKSKENRCSLQWAVLVSQGCHHKVSLTRWLQTTEMYPLTTPQSKSLNSRHWKGCAPSKTCRGGSFLASPSFQQPQASFGLGQASCLHLHMAIFSLCLCVLTERQSHCLPLRKPILERQVLM